MDTTLLYSGNIARASVLWQNFRKQYKHS